MFYDNQNKLKLLLIISNVVFILLNLYQFFNYKLSQNQDVLPTIILVYITGEVNKPNIYEIESDKRLNDLIIIAGGLTEKADLNALNLADSLYDGKKIIIPPKSTGGGANNTGKININTASALELQRLNGIGVVKSNAIVKYREEHGPFTNITQIMKVSGIGDATYEKIKNDICV